MNEAARRADLIGPQLRVSGWGGAARRQTENSQRWNLWERERHSLAVKPRQK